MTPLLLVLLAAPAQLDVHELHAYVTTSSTADDVEHKELALAAELARLGFSVSAAEHYFNVARNRTSPELLAAALTAIRDIMSGPHDELLLDRTLLTDGDLGRFPPELDAFIWFTRGLQDLREHRIEWAERHFGRIDPATVYRARSLYVLGAQRLRQRSTREAVGFFRKALVHRAADVRLRNDARMALARILFEDGELEGALDLYDRVEIQRRQAPPATLHLERAWTRYRMGRPGEAMATLHALAAPSYTGFFAPEVYLLRALIYRDLCQYIPAKRVIRSFHRDLSDTLRAVHEKGDLAADALLQRGAAQRGHLARLVAFREAITAEKAQVDLLGEGPLATHLGRIYELKGRHVDLQISDLARRETRTVAVELIELEEQMQLLDYEIGLELHRRRRKPDAPVASTPASSTGVRFDFAGEFWNGELDRYRFVLEDRCVREADG